MRTPIGSRSGDLRESCRADGSYGCPSWEITEKPISKNKVSSMTTTKTDSAYRDGKSEREMLNVNDICQRLAAAAGLEAAIHRPAISADTLSVAPERLSVEDNLRILQVGRLEAVVLAVPMAYVEGLRPGQDDATEVARRLSRSLDLFVRHALPKRPWGRIAILAFDEDFPNAFLLKNIIELSDGFLPKYAFSGDEDIAAVVDRIPQIAPMWPVASAVRPTWITSLSSGPMGPLSEVDIEIEPGPSLTVIYGGNNTGKTMLLSAMTDCLRGKISKLAVDFSEGRPAQLVPVERDIEHEMRAFRRLMSFGLPDGSLMMPIAFEGASCQAAERVGRALLDAVTRHSYQAWPGILLDQPTQGLDVIRRTRLMDYIGRVAQDRQVIVTTRDSNEAALWKSIADDWGVPYGGANLNGAAAVLKIAHASSPCP